MLYKAFSPNAEVSGSNIRMYVAGMGAFELMGKTILKAHNIDEEPKVDSWYNHQMFLDALKEIATKTGPHTISLIGSRIAENARFPQNVDGLEKALENLGEAYRVNHRGDNKSNKRAEKISEKNYKITVETPYPCELDTGYLKGLGKLYGISVSIHHDNSKPCRKNGAESCSYFVQW